MRLSSLQMRARAIAGVWLSCAVAAPARADESIPSVRAEAREIAERGDAQFDVGRCDKAVPLWREAAAKFRAPTILLRIARCQALVGKVVDAAATLESIAKEPLEPDAPAAFEEAKQEAARDLKNVRARVATLKITVDKAPDITVLPTLEIDDTRVPAVKVERYVDPGHHLIRVHAADVLWERALLIHDGEHRELRISLTSEPPPPPSRTQRNIGFIVGGTGAAALAVGIGFALSASAISKNLDAVCGPDHGKCPPSERGTLDRLKVHSRTADFTLGGGAALLATGALLLLTEPRPKAEPPRIRVSASAWAPGPGRSPLIGPGFSLSIAGTY